MRRTWGRWMAKVTIWLLGFSALFTPVAAALQASFLLGLESYARGWTQAGQELVEEAAADPANTEARLIFGMMQWAEGRPEAAQSTLHGLYRDAGGELRPHLQVLMGRLFLDLNLPGRAEAVTREALAGHPELMLGQLTLGEALLAQGRPADALEPLAAARTGAPDLSAAYLLEGQAHATLGQWEEARRVLEDGIKVDPWSAPMHFTLGQVYEHLNERDRANHSYRRAAQLDPSLAASIPPAVNL